MANYNTPKTDIHGRVYDLIEDVDGVVQAVAVAGVGGTGRTSSFVLPKGSNFAFCFKLTSGGTKAVQVEMEQSFDNVNFVIPDNKLVPVILQNVEDGDYHVVSYNPVATPYARLLFTGLAGNDNSTEVDTALMYVARS